MAGRHRFGLCRRWWSCVHAHSSKPSLRVFSSPKLFSPSMRLLPVKCLAGCACVGVDPTCQTGTAKPCTISPTMSRQKLSTESWIKVSDTTALRVCRSRVLFTPGACNRHLKVRGDMYACMYPNAEPPSPAHLPVCVHHSLDFIQG